MTLWVSEHLLDSFLAPLRFPSEPPQPHGFLCPPQQPAVSSASGVLGGCRRGDKLSHFLHAAEVATPLGRCPENLETSRGGGYGRRRAGPPRRVCVGPLGDAGGRHGVMEAMSWLPMLWGDGGKRGCRGDAECDGWLSPLGAGAGGRQGHPAPREGRAQPRGRVSLHVPWAHTRVFTSTKVAKLLRTDPIPAAGGEAAGPTQDSDSAGVKDSGVAPCHRVPGVRGCSGARTKRASAHPGGGISIQMAAAGTSHGWLGQEGTDPVPREGTGTMGQEGTEPVPGRGRAGDGDAGRCQ